ncbi:MAG: metallophosphoesterase [bacterium]|nr:metallophosphoesterase [bacterium]
MLAADFGLYLLAALGHFALWISIFNRIQAFGVPRKIVKLQEKFCVLMALLIPCLFIWRGSIEGFSIIDHWLYDGLSWRPLFYLIPCWGIALVVFPAWLGRQWESRRPKQFTKIVSMIHDVEAELGISLKGTGREAFLLNVPGNQAFQVDVNEKTFELPNWPAELNGLTIAHISDMHFTGYIRKEYFEFVCDRVNELNADIIVFAGDLLDRRACLEWIPDTIGRLSAPAGVYYVLGNHDRQHSETLREELNQALIAAGLIPLGGSWQTVTVNDSEFVLAGNEAPWFPPQPDMSTCPPREDGPPRVLVSHSPDQISWARKNEFDLMLAGHTHGGQIRLPIYGPLISPSIYGVSYASGEFFLDPVLMHVSRGVSGQHPIRLRCPPEATKLTILSPENRN